MRTAIRLLLSLLLTTGNGGPAWATAVSAARATAPSALSVLAPGPALSGIEASASAAPLSTSFALNLPVGSLPRIEQSSELLGAALPTPIAAALAAPAGLAAEPAAARLEAPAEGALSTESSAALRRLPEGTRSLFERPGALSLNSAQAESLPAGEAHAAGERIMGRVLGQGPSAPSEEAPTPARTTFFTRGFFGPGGDDESTGALRPMGAFGPSVGESSPEAAPPAPEPAGEARRGILARLAAPFRILPDARRNWEYWKFLGGQSLLALGVNFPYTALPGLVSPKGEQDSGNVSLNRTVNWTSQALAGLTTGPLVDRSSTNGVMAWTYLGRSLLMFTVPILFFNGYFTFAAFQVVIFSAGFLQSMSGTASSVAFSRILGDDEKSYNRANAVYNLVLYGAGVVGPLLAGSFIAALNARWGFLSGNALAYGVYALLLLAVGLGYRFFLKLPRDEVVQARRTLAKSLRSGPAANPRVKGVSVEHVGDSASLVVALSGDPTEDAGIPKEHEGFPVKTAAAPRPLAQIWEGFRLNWSDRFLRLTMLFSIAEALAGEALIFGALPRYIAEVMTVPDASWLSAVPWVGPFFAGLATRAGAFGLYLAVSSLGLGLASFATMFLRAENKPGNPSAGYWGRLDTLEKQSFVTSMLFGLGSLAYLGVFFIPNLWMSAGMMLLSSILQAPAQTVWSSMHQRVLQERFPDKRGNVLSARGFYFTVLSIAGLLLFGWVLTAFSTPAVMLVVGASMLLITLTHVLEPFFLFPLKKG